MVQQTVSGTEKHNVFFVIKTNNKQEFNFVFEIDNRKE